MEVKRFFVYTRESPRAVALVPVHALDTGGTFLSISLRSWARDGRGTRQVQVTQAQAQELRRHYSPLDMDPVYGCIGTMEYLGDAYIFLLSQCALASNVGDEAHSKRIYRVTDVVALSLSDSIYDRIPANRLPGGMHEDIAADVDVYGISTPCVPLIRFLRGGSFYFSPDFDVTRSTQARALWQASADEPSVIEPDPKFTWNGNMLNLLLAQYRTHMCSASERTAFDNAGYAVPLIQGHVRAVGLDKSGNASYTRQLTVSHICIVSRSSSMRSGARFLTRGIDDDGGVANEVETEVIFATRYMTFSHVQLRGSVPVFWAQDGLQIGSHKVQITRSPAASLPATEKHFADILGRYKRVGVVNLLKAYSERPEYITNNSAGSWVTSEADLGYVYEKQIASLGLPDALVSYVAYDYNNEVRGGNFERVQDLVRQLSRALAEYQYFLCDNESGEILGLQRGVHRTNCLDCLDRTNVVQSVLSRTVFGAFIEQSSVLSRSAAPNVLAQLGAAWATNGDAVSRLYAGTGALKSSVTTGGRSGLAGFLSDASRSLSRFVQGTFQDTSKQGVIDSLLGSKPSTLHRATADAPLILYDPYRDSIASELQTGMAAISRRGPVHLMLTTYNVHGRAYTGEPLGTWLAMPRNMRADIVAVAFQEMVNLDVQSVVVATDPHNRQVWERALARELNAQFRSAFGTRAHGEYILVTSDQLVGVGLLVFAHSDAIGRIHGVEVTRHKTGLAGLAGNKGCVALHFDIDDSSICLVSAHLASGATSVLERNSDYASIHNGAHFRCDRRIDDHDYVFWLGDLNYRIDLPNAEARRLISDCRVQSLAMYDQLSLQIAERRAFIGYLEAEIRFPPTYKYDTGTSIYDTSDKVRVPSWTDRILYKGKDIRVLEYYRDELAFSDHKPVLAMVEIDVVSIDRAKERRLIRRLYANRHAHSQLLPSADQKLIDVDCASIPTDPPVPSRASTPTLPPPSSDTHAWWDDDVPDSRDTSSERIDVLVLNPFAVAEAAAVVSKYNMHSPIDVFDDMQSQNLIDIPWEPIKPTNAR